MRDAPAAHHGLRQASGPLHAADPLLAEIAAELRVIHHRSGWSRTLAIGELILKHFFDGNVREWRARRRDKEASLRRLAQRSDCPLGRSALSEAVAVYVACRDIPGGKIRDELSPSHLAATLQFDAPRRIELLEQAIARKWSVRELRKHVAFLRKDGGERRGRPRSTPARAALTCAKNAARMLGRADALLRAAGHVDADLLRCLQLALTQAEEKTRVARARLVEPSAPRVTLAPAVSKARVDRELPKLAVG
jgi:hypothetical protein